MKRTKNIFKKLLFSLIIMVLVLGIQTISNADGPYTTRNEVPKTWGTTRANLPANNISGSTGMFPQYWTGTTARQVTLPGSRLSWNRDTTWTATMDGDIVYCAERGAYVRYGQYDSATHYMIPESITVQETNISIAGRRGKPVGSTLSSIKSKIQEYYQKFLEGRKYYTNPRLDSTTDDAKKTLYVKTESNFPGGKDAIGYYLDSSGTKNMGLERICILRSRWWKKCCCRGC